MPRRRRIATIEPDGNATAAPEREKAGKGGGPGAAGALALTISATGGPTVTIPVDDALDRAAMHWSWVVRNRDRWSGQGDAQRQQRALARKQLVALHVAESDLDALGAAELIQVGVPWGGDEVGWAGRIFPWEYVLSAATTYPDARRRPWVIRRLVVDAGAGEAQRPVTSGAIVTSAPGRLREAFSFTAEQLLVQSALGGLPLDAIADPLPAALHARLSERRPDLVHLAGVDNHQGAALLRLDDANKDGYLLADETGKPTQVAAENLAQLVAADAHPRLVSCNFWNSGQRTAPLLVAAGAESSIGFQDQFDDGVAELFFATFYRTWAASGWATARAFEDTLLALKAAGASLRGTGVVLWTRRDVLADLAGAPVATTPPGARVTRGLRRVPARGDVEAGLDVGAFSFDGESSPGEASSRGDTYSAGGRAPAPRPADALWVEVRPLPSVNYSLLHNNRPLFDQFRLRKHIAEAIRGVEIEVVLFVGGDSYPFRTTIDVSADVVDLRDRIRVPLTSTMLRAFRESVQSVVYVSVHVDGTTIHQDTYPILLEPIEEWSEDAGGIWLPSFVLPRDPAVAEVIDAAASLARVLRDDGKAAFDGYQSVVETATDGYECVEAQVKAIWSVLAYQFGLRYINPPPTYAQRAQRLRTPTDVRADEVGHVHRPRPAPGRVPRVRGHLPGHLPAARSRAPGLLAGRRPARGLPPGRCPRDGRGAG